MNEVTCFEKLIIIITLYPTRRADSMRLFSVTVTFNPALLICTSNNSRVSVHFKPEDKVKER